MDSRIKGTLLDVVQQQGGFTGKFALAITE
jgi:hypothetical protein